MSNLFRQQTSLSGEVFYKTEIVVRDVIHEEKVVILRYQHLMLPNEHYTARINI